jgi:hypothetical protein
LGKVRHESIDACASLHLRWEQPQMLKALKSNRHLLPSLNWSREWSGVYRVFKSDTVIDRCCGKDKTGTLYIGLAGCGKKKWSILHTRLKDLVYGDHHKMRGLTDRMRQTFASDSLAVEWAFTQERFNYPGPPRAEAEIAEAWLLNTYRDTFGEYPPWNEKV